MLSIAIIRIQLPSARARGKGSKAQFRVSVACFVHQLGATGRMSGSEEERGRARKRGEERGREVRGRRRHTAFLRQPDSSPLSSFSLSLFFLLLHLVHFPSLPFVQNHQLFFFILFTLTSFTHKHTHSLTPYLPTHTFVTITTLHLSRWKKIKNIQLHPLTTMSTAPTAKTMMAVPATMTTRTCLPLS